jgi:hypothetical protein
MIKVPKKTIEPKKTLEKLLGPSIVGVPYLKHKNSLLGFLNSPLFFHKIYNML